MSELCIPFRVAILPLQVYCMHDTGYVYKDANIRILLKLSLEYLEVKNHLKAHQEELEKFILECMKMNDGINLLTENASTIYCLVCIV